MEFPKLLLFLILCGTTFSVVAFRNGRIGTTIGGIGLWGCRPNNWYGVHYLPTTGNQDQLWCKAYGVQYGTNVYEWEHDYYRINSNEHCQVFFQDGVPKGLSCWIEDALDYDCHELFYPHEGLHQEGCEFRGCAYLDKTKADPAAHNHHAAKYGQCYDECAVGHRNRIGSNSEQKCTVRDGCVYLASNDHCRAGMDRRFYLKQCQSVDGWYDDDGPKYNCEWYHKNPTWNCYFWGHKGRNFGKTADEACCGCRMGFAAANDRRRALEGIDVPSKRGFLEEGISLDDLEHAPIKRGFAHHGGVMKGIEREIIPQGDVLKTGIMDSEDVSASEEVCEEVSWWKTGTELECPEGHAIGTLFQSGLTDSGHAEFSIEKGYCCKAPVTIECLWVPIYQHALGKIECGDHFVLTGFRMEEDKITFEHIEAMKCCRLD